MTEVSSRLGVAVFAWVIGLLAGLGSSPAPAQGGDVGCGMTRDLALVNGRIYQMNDTDSTASSVLIKNGRVASLDPNLDSEDDCVDTIDLQGRVVFRA